MNACFRGCFCRCHWLIVFVVISSSFARMSYAQLTLGFSSNEKIDSLWEEGKFAEAEQLAREKRLDLRLIATLCAHAGKKDEAFALLLDSVRLAPEEIRTRVVRQCEEILSECSSVWGQEFIEKVKTEKIAAFDENELRMREVDKLVRADILDPAIELYRQVLDSPYAGEDVVRVGLLLLSKINFPQTEADKTSDDRTKEKQRKELMDILVKKYPDNLDVRIQSIAYMVFPTPDKALVELERLQREHPEFCSKTKDFIHRLKADAFEAMGELERAIAENKAMLGTSFKEVAKMKIATFETRLQSKRDLQAKIDAANAPHELPPRDSSRRWRIVIGVNLILIGLILYGILRGKKRAEPRV